MMIVVPLLILLVPLGVTVYFSRYFWKRDRTISVFFIGWFLVALGLNAFPIYPGVGIWVEGDRARTPIYLAIMALPVVIYLIARSTSLARRTAIDNVPTSLLVGSQFYRVVGFTFYFAYLGGLYPAEIAFPAAIMDVFIGITALPLAYLITRRPMRAAVVGWNAIGLFDFALAVSLVVLSVYGVVSLTPEPSAIGQVPSMLTTVFAVPFGVIIHLEVLRRLLKRQLPVAQA
ncbi:hypothetical protein QTO30_12355 [Yoonia sp. GPGPB17]|uniref:hypothetical protein n=1 Tax=Yoonia sp. GPGPB17 TaxID=3026147 RepID=UPI0030C0C0C4